LKSKSCGKSNCKLDLEQPLLDDEFTVHNWMKGIYVWIKECLDVEIWCLRMILGYLGCGSLVLLQIM
jgi:hypothetical protein